MDMKIFSVSEINSYIKGLLENDFNLSSITVSGEISNFTHHRSGHMYFTLKDEKSALRCVFFKGSNMHLKFLPSGGMKVWGKGRISVYEASGQYQLYVEELEPAGMGALYLAFEQLKKKLEREGLFRDYHKKPLPSYPAVVALVTSPTGAVLQDILSTASRRFAPVKFLVVESLMQGAEAPADLVAAIKYLNRMALADVIVLARGGGSLEDLWAFNDENVARTIFDSAIPVISAVGHETDYTISDFVADYRAPTPTGAATVLFPDRRELKRHVSSLSERLAFALRQKTQRERTRLEFIIRHRFYRLPLELIRDAEAHFQGLKEHLRQLIIYGLQEKAHSLATADVRLEGLSPLKIMKRGYSFCRDENGKLVVSAQKLIPGQRLELSFADGKAWSRVEDVDTGLKE